MALSEIQSIAKFLNRDELEIKLKMSGERLISAEIKAIACPECLVEIQKLKKNLREYSSRFSELPLPEGSHHSAMLIRELLLKARGQWTFPYKEVELCHCRNVATQIVDATIMGGVHNVSAIGEKTMAGTACGTCRPVTQLIIDFRLHSGDDDN